MSRSVRIQQQDFSVDAEIAQLRSRHPGAIGAIASFIGLVRDRREDAAVNVLHLEHYPGMTERSIQEIVDQAWARWQLLDTVIIHRVGDLLPNDQIVFVQVASAHRPDAFAACEFLMDYLKTDAVLWKRESQQTATSTSSHWVQSTDDDYARRRDWEDQAPPGEA